MTSFAARSRTLTGGFAVNGPVDGVFPLFSPAGERRWVPGWDLELLHPPDVDWAEGLIFRTCEETGDAIWIVTRLDRASHSVEYHRVEPGRYVARVAVRCRAASAQTTDVSTAYEFIGLSAEGNAEIDRMSDEAYAEKMARWKRWIDDCLKARG